MSALVTASLTPVRTEADRIGPPGAHAGTLTVRAWARSLGVARDPAWGNVGQCSAPAGHHDLILMRRRVSSGIVPRVAPGRQGCVPDARRSLLMDMEQNGRRLRSYRVIRAKEPVKPWFGGGRERPTRGRRGEQGVARPTAGPSMPPIPSQPSVVLGGLGGCAHVVHVCRTREVIWTGDPSTH